MSSPKVAYILLHFPYLTETFVAEEIQAIQSQGIDVQIISLLEPGCGPVQPLSQQLMPYTWYAPGLLTLGLWGAQLRFLFRSPWLYLRSLVELLRQPYPRQPVVLMAKRLVIFLKAVAVANHLKGSGVQLLHSHFAWLSGAAAWITARLLGLPFTVTVHAYDLYFSNDLLPLVSSQAHHIIAISEYNRQQVAALQACPAEAISVIHCGVDMTHFRHQSRVREDRHAKEALSILSVGSLVAKKGHRYLIDACHLLRRRGLSFTCTIIGGGPGEPALRQQLQDLGLQHQVRLLGALTHSEIVAAYYQHDLFVLACVETPDGDKDGIPVVLMEAGAAGLPLISTQVSGIPELVLHEKTGLLVRSGDAVALADAISTLAGDPALRARLGKNARNLVEDGFEIERNASCLASLFERIGRQGAGRDVHISPAIRAGSSVTD
jgi:glycosyltransferase involved in cell wall biosynthesis